MPTLTIDVPEAVLGLSEAEQARIAQVALTAAYAVVQAEPKITEEASLAKIGESTNPTVLFQAASDLAGYPTKIVCPVCGNDFIHLEEATSKPEGHGTQITTTFWGECNHRFATVVQFHRGQTFSRVERLEDVPVIDHIPRPAREMWRD